MVSGRNWNPRKVHILDGSKVHFFVGIRRCRSHFPRSSTLFSALLQHGIGSFQNHFYDKSFTRFFLVIVTLAKCNAGWSSKATSVSWENFWNSKANQTTSRCWERSKDQKLASWLFRKRAYLLSVNAFITSHSFHFTWLCTSKSSSRSLHTQQIRISKCLQLIRMSKSCMLCVIIALKGLLGHHNGKKLLSDRIQSSSFAHRTLQNYANLSSLQLPQSHWVFERHV